MASLFAASRRSWLWTAPSALAVVSPARASVWFQPALGAVRSFGYQRHKRLLKHAKGYRGKSKNCFTVAIRRVEKAWQYAYRDRKNQRRTWRRMWIQRMSAGARQYGMRYSRLIAHLRYCNISLNRKVLADLAAMEPFAFKAVMDAIQMEHQQYMQQKEVDETVEPTSMAA